MGKIRSKNKENNADITKAIVSGGVGVGSSIIGSLVGLAVGGPIGAVVGAAVAPAVSTGADIAIKYWGRRKKRAEELVACSLTAEELTDEAVNQFINDDDRVDEFIFLIKSALENDKSLDKIYSGLMRELVLNRSSDDRVAVFNDAIHGLRAIHLKVLKTLYSSHGILSAKDISEQVGVSEIELRGIVRTLELKGMIIDNNEEPTIWQLREMGVALIEFLIREENK